MVNSISTLSNMEYQLYGGRNYGTAAPSISNNYVGNFRNTSLFNQYGYNNGLMGNYGNTTLSNPYGYNTGFTGNYGNPYGYNTGYTNNYAVTNPQNPAFTQNTQVGQYNTNFAGLSNQEVQNLADYYAKNNVLEEGFKGAAAGGLSWMAFENAQSLLHPINGTKSYKEAHNIFKNVSEEFIKKNKLLTQEAYDATQKLIRDGKSKWFYSKWLRKPLLKYDKAGNIIANSNSAEYKKLITEMEAALNSGEAEKVAEITEKMKAARGFDGRLVPGKKLSIAERLSKKSAEITKNTNTLLELNTGKIGSLVKNSFKKDFIGFMAFETIFNIGKIITAFGKDTESGLKQTGQSLAKSAISTAGWCLGRAAGTWLGAKAGAAIGTAICPGAGTVAGALIGFTVGSIGMWLGSKIGNKLLGADVADKIEAQNQTKSQEGQLQLAQFALEKVQEKGTIDPSIQSAMYKIAAQSQAQQMVA